MTNGELGIICGAIVTGLGGVGTAIKFAADGVKTAINRNSDIMLKFVESAARLEVKLDKAHEASVATEAAVQEIAEEVSAAHDTPVDRPSFRKSPPKGYPIGQYGPIVRPKSGGS